MAITKQSIWAVADALDQVGEKPTLANVRKKVGGGSYTTISEAMTEWHAQRAIRLAPAAEPVPEKVGEGAAAFAAMVWQVAQEIAEGRLQAERAALEEARQQFQAEREEATAFADQLAQELEGAKGMVGEFSAALDQASREVVALQLEKDQERVRADRQEAVAEERARMVEMLKAELVQVRADKDSEIARLLERKPKPEKPGKQGGLAV